MIALLNNCLLFQLATGESVPCSVEMISVEIVSSQDRQLGFTLQGDVSALTTREIIESDLRIIACQSAESLELLFFPALRMEVRSQLRQSPKLLRFRGLRGCVKQLAGARRWSDRCDRLQEQIVGYLRECLSADREQAQCSLVVE